MAIRSRSSSCDNEFGFSDHTDLPNRLQSGACLPDRIFNPPLTKNEQSILALDLLWPILDLPISLTIGADHFQNGKGSCGQENETPATVCREWTALKFMHPMGTTPLETFGDLQLNTNRTCLGSQELNSDSRTLFEGHAQQTTI